MLYVEAVGERATSLPSETLVAWTDPALPAFVDVIPASCFAYAEESEMNECVFCFSPQLYIRRTIYPRADR